MLKLTKELPRILLIQSPPWSNLMPPLGLAYLSTYLRKNLVQVEIFDLNIDLYNSSKLDKQDTQIQDVWFNEDVDFWFSGKGNAYFIKNIELAAQKIVAMNIGIIGISTPALGILFANELIIRVKDLNPDIKIILGGGCTNVKEGRARFTKDNVDYFVIGEGERPLLGIIKKICLNDDKFIAEHCDIYKDNDKDSSCCVQLKGEQDINQIAYPTYEEFDLSLYEDRMSLPIMGSRGCINRCVFCQDCQMLGKYRWREPDNIIAEIKYHLNRYKIKKRSFIDLLVNGDIDRLELLCDKIIKERINIEWSCLVAVRKDMESRIFKKMKEAGCNHIVFGCESFSSAIIKNMKKGFSLDDARKNLRAACENNIHKIDINLIVGFPGENEKNIDETLKFLEENNRYITAIGNISLLKIIHGSYMYYHYDEYNIEPGSLINEVKWCTKDYSSTYEKRRLSAKQYIDVIAEMGIPIDKDPDGLKKSHEEDARIRIYFRKANLSINAGQYINARENLEAGLKKFPDSSDLLRSLERLFFKEAVFLISAKQYASARGKLEAGLKKFPDSSDLLRSLERLFSEEAVSLMSAKQYASAREKLEVGLKKFPDSLGLLKTLEWLTCAEADYLISAKQYASARGKLEAGLKKFPGSSDLLRSLKGLTCAEADYLISAKQYASARGKLEAGLKKFPDSPDLLTSLERLSSEEAVSLISAKQYASAKEKLETGLKKLPDSLGLLRTLEWLTFVEADYLISAKQYASARGKLEAGLKKFPSSLYLLTSLERMFSEEADSLISAKQYASARGKLEAGLKKLPDSLGLLKALKRLYTQTSQWSFAEKICHEMLRLDLENKNTEFELGQMYFRQNKLNQAYTIFVQLEKQDYINYHIYNEMGLISLKFNDYARAQSEFEKGLIEYPDNSNLVLNLGFVFLHQNRYIEAEERFRQAILLNAYLSDAYAGLGFVFLHLGKCDLAEAELKKAYQCDAKSIRTLTGLGRLFQEQGNFQLAEEKFKEAIIVDASIPEIYFLLEQVLIKNGKIEEAVYYKQKGQNLKHQTERYGECGEK